jgi:hypothetical protein
MGLPSGSHLSQGRVQVQCIGTVYVYIYPVLWEEVPEPAIREMTGACRQYLEVVLLPCRTMMWNSTTLQETYRSWTQPYQGTSRFVLDPTGVQQSEF